MPIRRKRCDLLVIGGGIAGCLAAIRARELGLSVILASKGTAGRSGCSIVAAGVYLGFESGDDLEAWTRDAVEISHGLDDPQMDRTIIQRSREIRSLMDQWGVSWEKNEGQFFRKPGLGMKVMQNAMFHGGRQMMWVLRAQVARAGAQIIDRVMVTDLLTADGRLPSEEGVTGAVGFHVVKGVVYLFEAKAVLVAAGDWGIGQFEPADCTGDGQAMAFRAGATMRNMEHLGFSLAPTVNLQVGSLQSFTGHGAYLRNRAGERYMARYSPELMERAPRPVIVQAAAMEMEAGRGPVYIDITHLAEADRSRLERVDPLAFKAFKKAGLDPAKELIEYCPTLYGNGPAGGVKINIWGETGIPGLFVCGGASDRSYAGVPGLTGASVTGYLAAEGAAAFIQKGPFASIQESQVEEHLNRLLAPRERSSGLVPKQVYDQAREIVLQEIGVLKEEGKLRKAVEMLSQLRQEAERLYADDFHHLMNAHETINIIEIARLIAEASLLRTETRYFHYRKDFPERDDKEWRQWTLIRMKSKGELEVTTMPIGG